MIQSEIDIKYPRVLVISNNSFSDTNNNGKTLASFFEDFPVQNIAQLYFNSEIPYTNHYENYFRISDVDVVKSVMKKTDRCGGTVEEKQIEKDNTSSNATNSLINKLKNYDISRIFRELFWKSNKWQSNSLNHWLDVFNPDIIFFCAGDSGFAYEITNYIQKNYNTKLVVYITDDYVLPRKTLSPFWWFRRNSIINKMKDTVQKSDLFVTISEQMRNEYKKLFGKDSILAINMTESLRDDLIASKENENITLVYAGGLHFKRYKTLNLLARAIKKYNEDALKQKAILKIYSSQSPTDKLLKYLNVDGASEYCGYLNPVQLKEVLNSCDIPVHVEAFDSKSIESTRLSISTKIPEYLSLGKPILAIGPEKVASMQYLENCAYCIINSSNISSGVNKLLNDKRYQEVIAEKSRIQYDEFHNKEKNFKKLKFEIIKIYTLIKN